MAMQMRFLQTLSDIGTEQKNKVFGEPAQRERTETSGAHTMPDNVVPLT